MTTVRAVLSRWLDDTASLRAEPRIHAAFRALLGALSLVMAVRSLPLVDYLWFERGSTWTAWAPVLHGTWVVLAALVVVGLGGRALLLAHFVVVTVILDFEISGSNIEETLLIVPALWLSFTGTGQGSIDAWMRRRRGRPVSVVPGWPLYLMGVNLGLLLMLAGLTKSFDPLWRQGTGFYYTFLLPWLKRDVADPLLDHRWLMWTMNLAALVYELGFLVLYLIPGARVVALAMAGFFFASLAYPFELGFIGPLGLTLLLGAVAATGAADVRAVRRMVARIRRRDLPAPRNDGDDNGDRATDNRFASTAPPANARAVVVGLSLFMAAFGFANAVGTYSLQYPLLYWPLAVVEDEGLTHGADAKESLLHAVGNLLPWTKPITDAVWFANEHTTKIRPFVLFSSVHTVGIWVYRVGAAFEDGAVTEPFRLVDENMYAGPASAGLEPRFLQASMYWFGGIANRWSADPAFALTDDDATRIEAVLTHARGRLTPAQRARLRSLTIAVRPIAVPDAFAGNVAVDAVPWRALLRYDVQRDTIALGTRPTPFPSRPIVTGLSRPARMVVRP